MQREILDPDTEINSVCCHCNQPCVDTVWRNDKPFCCLGCKTVYEILSDNELCEYYELDTAPGIKINEASNDTYAYLDKEEMRKELVEYDSADFTRIQFYIPAIHCVSCIWLLENLQRLCPGVLKSEVNFASKTVRIDFKPNQISLGKLATVLHQIGYSPKINLNKETKVIKSDTSMLRKLALAGFCFGNVMLFSFPEYLGIDQADHALMRIFSWLNLGVALPVLIYSSRDYFLSAINSFRQYRINIDVPIAIGLIALFARSSYDIITHTGPGYMDSFTGLVFFLLIGRWFQDKTYQGLAFDRDFKSYFPLAVHKQVDNGWIPVIIYELEPRDKIRIRNEEIIPADCVLLSEVAYVDYSFVSGESKPVKAFVGDHIYAGGKLIGKPILLEVEKKTSQSQLTSLWNHDAFSKPDEKRYQKIIDQVARAFTWVVLVIAIATGIYWYGEDSSNMWLVVTSVLMVACPCALSLAAPFTYGNMVRVFGQHNFYVKNSAVIEKLAQVDSVVFDKTGTVTTGQKPSIQLIGFLSDEELGYIRLLSGYSVHPLSTILSNHIRSKVNTTATDFIEFPGIGIQGTVDGNIVKIGSARFTQHTPMHNPEASYVYVSINSIPKAYFSITTSVRNDVKAMLSHLGKKCTALISGDNAAEHEKMSNLFGSSVQLHFNQSPFDKLNFIRQLQQSGKKVLMIGDGLNDSGALQQSDVGIAVTDDTSVFSPACDGILQGNKISKLNQFINLAKASTQVLKISFAISFLYNAIAIGFAVTGHLTPLIAAVLMPLSSITVVGFSSGAVNLLGRTLKQQPT
ncbi:MAG: heavy metal translocating P-type ATPase metal-binding domain-containing protein [Cyclobacteriaceae bacterium]|nr:heavy metal translocating P-type ATPase metal-binding domain-containing protein [Cyclobacteriaceae bacterium]